MAFGFVKQSDGHIKICSEEGLGTSVKIYLPRAAGKQDTAVEVLISSTIEGGDEVILIVEDDALVRQYVVTQIASLGYTPLEAANATEALKIIDSGVTVDLLFTDVIIPGPMNGRQLVDEALKRHPSLKTLFTSGYTEKCDHPSWVVRPGGKSSAKALSERRAGAKASRGSGFLNQ